MSEMKIIKKPRAFFFMGDPLFNYRIRDSKHEIDSAERLDLSLFGKLKALSRSKGSPTGLVAGRNKFKCPKYK
jgi:hypothetical protein